MLHETLSNRSAAESPSLSLGWKSGYRIFKKTKKVEKSAQKKIIHTQHQEHGNKSGRRPISTQRIGAMVEDKFEREKVEKKSQAKSVDCVFFFGGETPSDDCFFRHCPLLLSSVFP